MPLYKVSDVIQAPKCSIQLANKRLFMNESITIGELTPATRGGYSLRFEVVETASVGSNPEELLLKLADDTGCINAYFNNHGKHIKIGNVYDLTNFRCKVVDHHLRVELLKDSKLARIKHEMGFKDLFNNLSEKFYISKAEHKGIEEKQPSSKPEPPKVTEEIKSQPTKNGNEKNNGKKKVEENVPNQKVKYIEAPSKPIKKQSNIKQHEAKEQKPQKKKFIEKKMQEVTASETRKSKDRQFEAPPTQRVFLKDLHLYRQKDINLFVQVYTGTRINANNYILVRAGDSSGSTYLQFDRRAHLENKAWYCLRRFKVFGDTEYGYVASQQKYSTFDVLDEYEEVPDHRPIYFLKPK